MSATCESTKPISVAREPRVATKADFYAVVSHLPERIEFARGVIGPFSDLAKLTLLANWGADDIIRLTGPDIWRAALAALDKNG